MEEKKVSATKVAEKAGAEKGTQERMSYEQLHNVAVQLSQQNRQLAQKVHELEGYAERANISNLFSYLQFLFEVVKNPIEFENEFVADCSDRVKKCMTMLGGVIMPESDSSEEAASDDANGQKA